MASSTFKKRKTKVIGEGGFGCVLNPNISCKLRNGKRIAPNRKYISKLMEMEDFEKEYRDIKSIKDTIEQIPNYKKYFLIDIHECRPEPLSERDMHTINRGCKYFENKRQEEVMNMNTLIMDYGGIRLDSFLEDHPTTKPYKIHKKMLNFIENGVFALNTWNIYHCDIKMQNILYFKRTLKLIDWGFSYNHNKSNSFLQVPSNFRRYPLHFNMPITVCLFGDSIASDVNRYLKSDVIASNVAKYAWKQILSSRRGHYTLIETYFNLLKPINQTKSFQETIHDILTGVFARYIDAKSKTFDSFKYFTEIYLPNVDIFGLVACYISMMKITRNSQNSALLYDYYFRKLYFQKIIPADFLYDLKKATF
jgi:serine/threonine protein kinase